MEYDAIAELVASAAILYIDETGWKVGKRSCYTWIFSTLTTVLYKWGVGRGKVVLTEVLGEPFDGIGVTDDMSVLASLSKRMEHFTLGSVLAEINRWIETGQSVFREELASIQAATAPLSKPPP